MEHDNAPPNLLGQWMKKRRRELDLTQDALAEQIDCSLATLYKIEAGSRRPSRQIAELLAQALGVPAEQQAAFVRFARLGGQAPPFLDVAFASAEAPRGGGAAPPIHLPAQFTPLLGREAEIVAIGRLLHTGTRLLTLVGPPGIGKTRLSIEVAGRYAPDFADGVFFVGLAPVRDPALVLGTVGSTLGVQEGPGQGMLDTLAGFLGRKQVLLVLDNCEQVVEAGPQILALLAQCPRLHVLATSREILRVHGEQQYPVPPLPLPASPVPLDMNALLGYPAVALFVSSAQAAQPSFALTEENAPTILAICRRLDGLPLAIELVAARINLLPPAALLHRLHARLDLLTAGARNLPPRHRTLRDCIAWSYDLLPAPEQRLFRRLGIFTGGWTLDAATAVCNGAGDLPIPVLEGLGALVDKSLVLPLHTAGSGEARYGMLETIREYALERLDESGEATEIRRQHAAFYLDLAETAAPYLRGPEQKAWLDRLEREHDNARAALTWALSPGPEAESRERWLSGVRLAGALDTFWLRRSHLTEGRRWYRQALELAARVAGEDPAWPRARMRALQGMGDLAYTQGSRDQARGVLEQSLALARALGDKQSAAAALACLGPLRGYYGNEFDAGRTLLTESIALFRQLGNQWGLARATGFLGYIPYAQGDYPAARTLFEESLALFRAVQDPWGTAWALLILGEAERCLEHYAAANTFYEQSLAINRELGDKSRMAVLLNNLANIARNQGDLDRALALFLQCLTLAQDLGNTLNVIGVISGLAGIIAAQGQPERGAQLLGAVQALHEALGAGFEPSEQQDFDRHVAATRAALSEEGFARAWTAGRSLTLAAALDLALQPARAGLVRAPTLAQGAPAPLGLTDREREVLHLLARGLSNKAIAHTLTISERTVNTHLIHIFSKLDVTSRSAAVAQAIRLGLAE